MFLHVASIETGLKSGGLAWMRTGLKAERTSKNIGRVRKSQTSVKSLASAWSLD
jgi:hypothetical protein